MKQTIPIIVNVILPLLIGGVIYISFRSVSIRMFDWFDKLGIQVIISSLREFLHPFKKNIPNWVYFSLPDGLWVYSFSSTYMLIWKKQFKVALAWLVIPFMFGCGIEIAQLFKIFPGTFDVERPILIEITTININISIEFLFYYLE